jgi:putative DNA primase/helicase
VAELFVQKYNKKFYYLFETDQWIFFDEQKGWIVEKQEEYKNSWWQNLVFQLASQTKPLQIEDSEKWIRARHSCVNRYSTHSSMMAVFKILKNRLDVRQASGVFDGEPHLLGVKNGVIDLRNGSFKPHNIKTLVTSRTSVSFNPKAKAPRWRKFISEVVPRHEKYIQVMMGYSISGLTDLQKMWILTGDGSNGKSTFLETIMGIIGKDYGQKAAHTALLQSPNTSTANPELVRMRGKRLILLSETAQNANMNENNVKQLTGGDTITARGLYADYVEFYVIGKFILATNHLPKIQGVDEAIWRRLEIIRFDARFNNTSDPNLKQDLLDEYEGILNWLIEGAVAFYKNKKVLNSTSDMNNWKSDYRNGEDLLKPFLDEEIEEAQGNSVLHSDLFQSYVQWCQRNEIEHDNPMTLGKRLNKRGYVSKKFGKYHTTKYINIKLKNSPNYDRIELELPL